MPTRRAALKLLLGIALATGCGDARPRPAPSPSAPPGPRLRSPPKAVLIAVSPAGNRLGVVEVDPEVQPRGGWRAYVRPAVADTPRVELALPGTPIVGLAFSPDGT